VTVTVAVLPGRTGAFAIRRAPSINAAASSPTAAAGAAPRKARYPLEPQIKENDMPKGQQKGNREAKKPKKEKPKVIAAAPNRATATWQPDFASGRKK
jgi:hypothetical protein